MRIGSLANALQYSSSGLAAERFRMDVISGNIANANTVARPGQDGYRRREVVLDSTDQGVKITSVIQDMDRPCLKKVDWSSPFHDPATGEVTMTNVDPTMEMVDMIGASRAYEANIAAFNTAKGMINSALQIGKI
ncbi:MAG: flagellar basal body rod protein FlgC [Armatimonadetes bacterium]|nr:flagellar basal body rod protein FlgC [Armatimonadota bacterium]MBS1700695.1 flagellar basal body rod protein FlgC [Armatimonadota bacterium]MBS1728816.1 flagellar basal body rod protein FlgC [Armatimonadota bacterium]